MRCCCVRSRKILPSYSRKRRTSSEPAASPSGESTQQTIRYRCRPSKRLPKTLTTEGFSRRGGSSVANYVSGISIETVGAVEDGDAALYISLLVSLVEEGSLAIALSALPLSLRVSILSLPTLLSQYIDHGGGSLNGNFLLGVVKELDGCTGVMVASGAGAFGVSRIVPAGWWGDRTTPSTQRVDRSRRRGATAQSRPSGGCRT